MQQFDAVLLAGSRPGPDPLVEASGAPTKALMPVSGKPMVCHVGRTLLDHPRLGRVIIAAQHVEAFQRDPEVGRLMQDDRVELAEGHGSIAATLSALFEDPALKFPLVVTTADNILLDAAMIDHFLSLTGDNDLAIAMVRRDVFRRTYPDARRTWLKFRGGQWSGANLFWFGSRDARRVLEVWRGVEQDRKKARKLIGMFGPTLMVLALLRLLPIERLLARAGRKLGLAVSVVPMPQPEACIDADKPDDIDLIEKILAQRAQLRR